VRTESSVARHDDGVGRLSRCEHFAVRTASQADIADILHAHPDGRKQRLE
jgi:hypothetical protein